jgi:hypothetical protein
MSGRLRLLLAVGCAVACLTPVRAQIPRDAIGPPAGTAGISGTVLADDRDARPLAGAIVIAVGSALQPSRWTQTDEEGRFSLTGLPAGNLTLTATKAGYLTMAYGQKRPGRGSGVALSLAAGQQMDALVVRLARGGVITGTVTDEAGVPRRGLPVIVREKREINGEMRLLDSGATAGQLTRPVTDDRGTYRAYGLAPGNYVVSAALPMLPDLGPGQDVRRPTAAELQWADTVLGSGAAGPAGTTPIPSIAPGSGQALASVPVYFPGTSDAAAATVVSLGAGEERTAVDFAVSYVPATRVSGVIFGPDGQPAPGTMVSISTGTENTGVAIATRAVRADSAGAFTLGGLPPGAHTITARSAPPVAPRMVLPSGEVPAIAGGGGARVFSEAGPDGGRIVTVVTGAAGAAGGQPTLWADAEITATGEPITGLALTLRPGLALDGRVTLEGDTGATPPDFSRLRIALLVPRGAGIGGIAAAPAPVQADGTFHVAGVVPGRYRLQLVQAAGPAAGAAVGWTLKTAMAGDRDMADVPVNITPDVNPGPVVVTLSNRPAEITGTLFDAAGRPTPDYFVVIFSTDRAYWLEGSRRLRPPVRPASNGTFRVGPLVPGSYYVAALIDVDPEDLYDREFLEQVAAGALTVTLADAERKVQDLKLAGR